MAIYFSAFLQSLYLSGLAHSEIKSKNIVSAVKHLALPGDEGGRQEAEIKQRAGAGTKKELQPV